MSPAVAGVIFDLDGTPTAPGAIRFDRIRERIGMDGGGSIMAWIAAHARDEAERRRMEAVVVEEERVALDRMAIGPGFDALAAAIATFADDRDLLARCGANGPTRVTEGFLPEQMVDAYEDIYRELTAGGRR